MSSTDEEEEEEEFGVSSEAIPVKGELSSEMLERFRCMEGPFGGVGGRVGKVASPRVTSTIVLLYTSKLS